jgi:hypothetical protein
MESAGFRRALTPITQRVAALNTEAAETSFFSRLLGRLNAR